MDDALAASVSGAILRIRSRSPFFATLMMFAQVVARPGLGTAATDGRRILLDPAFVARLPRGGLEAVLLHETLHCALCHVGRRKQRDATRWNIAADIVVNGMIAAQGLFELPRGAIRDEKLEQLAAEEVYELLPEASSQADELRDLRADLEEGQDGDGSAGSPAIGAGDTDALGAQWRHALQQAAIVARGAGRGDTPAGFEREFDEASSTTMDWRTLLWRFLVRTPSDFEGFDRRFVGAGLYLDAMDGEALEVDIAIDTSGSVDGDLISMFMAEVRGILGAYPHVRARLSYADAALYGPWEIGPGEDPPRPQGGGGTSFRPFFEMIANAAGPERERIAIYLTDGYGVFPERVPGCPVLWVVAPGGARDEDFPFGEVARLRR